MSPVRNVTYVSGRSLKVTFFCGLSRLHRGTFIANFVATVRPVLLDFAKFPKRQFRAQM